MSATFSINIGSIIETTKKEDLFAALQDLPDNTQKMISPRDVRDAIFTDWSSAVFKLTKSGNSNTDYIGIDTSNPEDRDLKKKILIGKRRFGNDEILDSNIINNSDADVYFYNTKEDDLSQDSTKISILAGTNSSLHLLSPYIESKLNEDGAIDFNIVNPSTEGGNIDITSLGGSVFINGIRFPSIEENEAVDITGKILKYNGTYPNGRLVWADPEVSQTEIGSTSSPTNIYGSPVLLNGSSLEFVNDNLVPQTIGGINQGDSFPENSFNGQNWPLTEVLREMIYPYIEPSIDFNVTSNDTNTIYVEVGKTSSMNFTYSLTTYARESNEYIKNFFIKNDETDEVILEGSEFNEDPGSVTFSSVDYDLYYGQTGSVPYTMYVSNIWSYTISTPPNTTGFSYSSTSSVEVVSPVVCGIDNNIFTTSIEYVNLTQENFSDKYIGMVSSISEIGLSFQGKGYLYFLIPSYVPEIQTIKDPNGFVVHDSTIPEYSAFTWSNITLSDMYGEYVAYRTNIKCGYDGVSNFILKF